MKNIRFDYAGTQNFVSNSDINKIKDAVLSEKDTLVNATGVGSEYTGWVDLPINYDKDEYARIKNAAKKIKSNSEVLISIGIGGSYLGARAGIEALKENFYLMHRGDSPRVIFCGHSVSEKYLSDLINFIQDKDFSINVISKSGTTTETAIAFRVFKEILYKKYGDSAKDRIFCTTDKKTGALKNLADREGYETFVVPDDIGGRYSVLTAVGLLPIAVAGIDIDSLMAGAQAARELVLTADFEENPSLLYAANRNILYQKGKKLELFSNFEPSLHYFSEWCKQLFGESEGKEHKGIFPGSVDFSTDLHSIGQYIQDGERILFETMVRIEKNDKHVYLPNDEENIDGLNYLLGKPLNFVNDSAFDGAFDAHVDGGVPVMKMIIPELSAYYMGQLFYIFEFACAVSGYTLGVNPFDQPGVEKYKKNMFKRLGKPGY